VKLRKARCAQTGQAGFSIFPRIRSKPMTPSQESTNFGTIADIMRQTFKELEQNAAAQRDLR
jgi:hypothetical protein